MSVVQPILDLYGLREQPFAATADPAYFYATREYKECLFRVWTGLEGGHGPVVILGRPGLGKTMLLRKILADTAADPRRFNTAVVAFPSPDWSPADLLRDIVERFGLFSAGESLSSGLETLNRYLMGNSQRINTLIIDDAQNLAHPDHLEVLRLTQNLELPQRKLLSLVLFAQTEWAETLRQRPNFTQRLEAVFALSPLSLEDSRRLIEYRLRRAGASNGHALFEEGAVRLVHAQSEGIPRTLVSLCRGALAVAGRLRAPAVSREIAQYVIDRAVLPDSTATPAAPVEETVEAPVSPAAVPAPAPPPAAPPQGLRQRLARAMEERANQLLLRTVRGRRE